MKQDRSKAALLARQSLPRSMNLHIIRVCRNSYRQTTRLNRKQSNLVDSLDVLTACIPPEKDEMAMLASYFFDNMARKLAKHSGIELFFELGTEQQVLDALVSDISRDNFYSSIVRKSKRWSVSAAELRSTSTNSNLVQVNLVSKRVATGVEGIVIDTIQIVEIARIHISYVFIHPFACRAYLADLRT